MRIGAWGREERGGGRGRGGEGKGTGAPHMTCLHDAPDGIVRTGSGQIPAFHTT